MNQTTQEWARETLKSVKISIIERAKQGTLKENDQITVAKMIEEIQLELKQESERSEAIRELHDNLGRLQKEISVPLDKEKGIDSLEETVSAVDRSLDEIEKIKYIANALQLDAQSIIPLLEQLQQKQNEMRQSFQKAVDIDFQLYGKTSSLTERALEAYHFEITPDRQVVEAITKETLEEPAKNIPDRQTEASEPQKIPTVTPERAFYKEGDTIRLRIPGGMVPEKKKEIENQLFQAGARYYKGTIPAEESSTGKEVNYKSWYIKYSEGMDLSVFAPYIKENQKPAQSRKMITPIPKENETGPEKDVKEGLVNNNIAHESAVYQEGDIIKLRLPPAEQEVKREIENMLFKEGARYHKGIIPAEESSTGKEVNYKSWYIKYSEGMDLSAFAPYIRGKQPQRESVIKQLKQNQKEAEEKKQQHTDKEKNENIRLSENER